MFIPTTKIELKELGWDELDVIIISGDVYIDSPFDGAAVVGKWLLKNGFRVGIISQPNINTSDDVLRLGIPRLFWGVTSGCVDSMVANYTATKKRRNRDDLTPGGINNRRPDRALIKYVNLIRQHSKQNRVPIVIGGIEASLRRIAHYDYWDDKVRRSILFDSKADYLIYGMAEKTILELAQSLQKNDNIFNIRGLCYISKSPKFDFINLPSFEEVVKNKEKFTEMFEIFYKNNEPSANGLQQKTGNRYLIHNPPQIYPSQVELDSYFELDFEYDAHPFYKRQGKIKALETIKQSIISHRGCFGECNFCSIAIHQGKKVISRSIKSIINEVKKISEKPKFNGIIYDIGGPSANMYGMDCEKFKEHCNARRCIYPKKCKNLKNSHQKYLELLNEVSKLEKIKKIFISSGIRFDLVLNDLKFGEKFIKELAENFVSGQLKIAPEHISKQTLEAMGKINTKEQIIDFRKKFINYSFQKGKKQFLTYYFMAAHPACSMNEMNELKLFILKELKIFPEQVQIFTPTPSTYSTLMYYTEYNPLTREKIFVEKSDKNKEKQKETIINKNYHKQKRR